MSLLNPIHNPDRYMMDLRHLLSQGSKRIGFLIGAGAPFSIQQDEKPLIPDIAGLTKQVIESLSDDRVAIEGVKSNLADENPNIEMVLTRVRQLAQAIGHDKVHGLDGRGHEELAGKICDRIGSIVKVNLPPEPNPYSKLVSWIAGAHRDHAVEIFTPNYDLLMEEALERGGQPYFDGFTGAHKPFFDSPSISASDDLPSRWARLWKLHGSLGWSETSDGKVVRTGDRGQSKLIYPDHLKFDKTSRLPYSAMFERLRGFLTTPDSLLITCGFSFSDAHISEVLRDSLKVNKHTAVFAFQQSCLAGEDNARNLAQELSNLSVYASDCAVIDCTEGKWQLGDSPSEEWKAIRQTFWGNDESEDNFLLGDFVKFAEFIALARSQQMKSDSDSHLEGKDGTSD